MSPATRAALALPLMSGRRRHWTDCICRDCVENRAHALRRIAAAEAKRARRRAKRLAEVQR